MIDRRSFLKYVGLVPLIGAAPRLALADEVGAEKADYTLRIGSSLGPTPEQGEPAAF
jgi:hypothetical protein